MGNRAERRRLEKAGKIAEKPAVYMYTQDQIDKMIQDAVAEIREKAVDEATAKAFKMFMSIPVMVLHDKFGFGRIRLDRFIHYALIWFEAVQSGDTTLTEIMKIAEDECGVKVLEY